ncbi:YciI family protein [Kutzneria viridogrisea]|nr:YciI family protein [Kutzneria albida]
MIFVKSDQDTENGKPPSERLFTEMARYNEELVKAGVLLAAEGLHPSSRGARVHFTPEGTTVVDGPFAASGELVAGFWMIDVKSREEAVAWARRSPCEPGAVIEVRQVFESGEPS